MKQQQDNTIYTPYCYLIGWSKQNKFYYGVRYGAGVSPEDLWVKYFTSSKHVKAFRELHGDPDIIQIRKTFIDESSATTWEMKVIRRMNMPDKDNKWLNRGLGGGAIPRWVIIESNTGRVCCRETRKKIGMANTGRIDSELTTINRRNGQLGRNHTDETKRKIGNASRGRTHTLESKLKMSKDQKGKIISEETRRNMSDGQKGRKHTKATKLKISESNRRRVKSITLYSKLQDRYFTYESTSACIQDTGIWNPAYAQMRSEDGFRINKRTKQTKHTFEVGDIITIKSLYTLYEL